MRYNVQQDAKRLKESREDLKWLYEQMPQTKGCVENINKPESEGGCGAWCCLMQSPSLWYVEFLNTWNYIVHNWSDKEIIALIERSLRKYLFPNKEKGCVFWDHKSKLCSQHETRPYACRIYGVEPEQEFNDRLIRLKVLYPDSKPQCNLVSTVNGEEITPKHTKKWWTRLKGLEASIGVTENIMHDGDGGSYRHYHDHVLLHMFEDDLMAHLTEIRVSGDPMQKESCIRNVINTMLLFSKNSS